MDNQQTNPLDLAAIRERLAKSEGPQFWRSLEELADTEQFRQFMEDEFPQQARPLRMEMDRRQFMILAGASLALAGMTGCRTLPQEKLVPYVKAPEEIVPGKPLYYATAMPFGGFARGLLVESHAGRPTKIEGNPDHPDSLGSTDAITQASILNLYDPDRSKNIVNLQEISSWDAFLIAARAAMDKQRPTQGAGIRILTETVTSPTLADQIKTFRAQFPAAKWHQYEPVNRDNVRAGSLLAFGEYVHPVYNFEKANAVLSLDSDFLFALPGSVRYAREFTNGRRIRNENVAMNRLYAVESTPTLTGAMAEHRLPLRASLIEGFARLLASRLGAAPAGANTPEGVDPAWVDAVVKDLQAHKGASLVVPGEHQPPIVHALAHAMNAALGNVGVTVAYTEPIEAEPMDQLASLRELLAEMQAGKVEILLILGGNPVYTAPILSAPGRDITFAEQLTKVPFSVHLGLHEDETSARCKWHVPDTHYLEAWSDLRAYDGTASLVQPLILPLYENHSIHELLAALLDQPRPGYDIVRDYWRRQLTSGDFEKVWGQSLNAGLLPGTTAPLKQATLKTDFATTLPPYAPVANGAGVELRFQPDYTIWDGRYANNGWLQELPKPMTSTTWDNVVLMSPRLAERLDVTNEDVVRLEVGGRKVEGPVWISFGHPDNAVTIQLGYGRTRAGNIGTDIGFNANLIRTVDAPWIVGAVEVRKMGAKYPIATTDYHHILLPGEDPKTRNDLHGRDKILVVKDIEEFRSRLGPHPEGKGEAKKEGEGEVHADMFPDVVGGKDELLPNEYSFNYSEFNKWGMAIDLNVCIGCNACSIACQAENNIPVVGKDQVQRGREMHWIRVDRYQEGGMDNPKTYFQPVPCMQCEKAPCEPVCPVAATVHSHDGLNQMVYNRCVGTRYCSNNCPYKVRRFNFLNYANHHDKPVLKLMANPEVSVRGRGVMEKCTYCTQRISAARIEAKKAGRAVGGDEVVTACQQACPTQAIIFGDIADPNSQVAKTKAQPQNYVLLEDLQTVPRTTYLERFRNPNLELEKEA